MSRFTDLLQDYIKAEIAAMDAWRRDDLHYVVEEWDAHADTFYSALLTEAGEETPFGGVQRSRLMARREAVLLMAGDAGTRLYSAQVKRGLSAGDVDFEKLHMIEFISELRSGRNDDYRSLGARVSAARDQLVSIDKNISKIAECKTDECALKEAVKAAVRIHNVREMLDHKYFG